MLWTIAKNMIAIAIIIWLSLTGFVFVAGFIDRTTNPKSADTTLG